MLYNVIETYRYKDLERFTYAQLESEELLIENQPLILYDAFETSFDGYGEAVLDRVIDTYITEEVNGDYSLYVEVEKDDHGKYRRVKPLSIIKAQGQLFRIPQFHGIKDEGFKLKLNAKHISFDAAEVFTEDRRVNQQNVYETLSRLLEADTTKKYSIGATDLASTANANFIMEDFITSLFNKVLPRWGGELVRDNFKFTVKNRLGKYKPDVYIRFGKNSNGMERKVDYSNVVTKLYPVGKNGITIESVNNGINYVTSSKINQYPITYPKQVKFEDCETEEELIAAAEAYVNSHDTPMETIVVDFIDLEHHEAYDNLKNAIRMTLGDTITVYDEDLGIENEMRVVAIKIHAESGIKLKLTIGELAKTIADSMTYLEDRTNEIQDKISESITGSDDLKQQVVENTGAIQELNKTIENLNKDITSVNGEVGQLAALETDHKDDLVGAVNEVLTKLNNLTPGEGGGGSTEGGTIDIDKINKIYDSLILNGSIPPDVAKINFLPPMTNTSGRKPIRVGYRVVFAYDAWLHKISWGIGSSSIEKSVSVYMVNRDMCVINVNLIKITDNQYELKLKNPIRLYAGISYIFEMDTVSSDILYYDESSAAKPIFVTKMEGFTIDTVGAGENSGSTPSYSGGFDFSIVSAYA